MIKTDVFIVGKGPAGIQASIYTKRGNVDTTVVGKDIGMCVKARTVENFYGTETITGPELVENGIKQAQNLGIKVVSDEVVSVNFDGMYYTVKTLEETYEAIALCFASGAHRNVPRVRNIGKYEGAGVSYCAVCDAFFYRGKNVAVMGHGDYAANEAAELLAVASRVYVLTDGNEPVGQFDERCIFIHEKVHEVVGENKLEKVCFKDGSELEVNGLFIALGTASSTDLAQKLGVLVENNRIVVNENRETNLPGLFAAGDCTPGVQQIAKAIGDGCVAGMNMATYVRAFKRKRG